MGLIVVSIYESTLAIQVAIHLLLYEYFHVLSQDIEARFHSYHQERGTTTHHRFSKFDAKAINGGLFTDVLCV